MTTIRCLTYAAALTLPLFAAGCGKPAIVPAQGKITYRGYPVPNGVVVLTPEQKGSLAVGLIRDGDFVVYTGDHPGAYPGIYKVTVSSLAQGTTTSENSGRFEFPNSALPPRFREHDPGREQVTIKANHSNSIQIALVD